ncbi:MAG TPA: aminopeptidase [Burkholderiaceae bacterium]|nr:aminopeptidase [Burkholderiaceae bacterium]
MFVKSLALRRRLVRVMAAFMVVTMVLVVTGGCSTIGYYAQSVHGHLSMLAAARPIDELLADPRTDMPLRTRLEQVQRMRAFASRELGLPDNASYTRYADLKRPYVIWNVFATRELSLRLEEWCFPITGCVGYRGYFDKSSADAEAAALAARGFDVHVGGVPAYSTLGWFDDPVLNTFIGQPEGDVARLIFHELAHQVVFVKGDTTFNESFATTVEQEGVKRWFAAHANAAQIAAYENLVARRTDFLALLMRTKNKLEAVYKSDLPDAQKRERKTELFAQLRREYETMKRERWNGYAGYDRWFARELGNAQLASVAAYTQLVPAFNALLEREGRDLDRFYERAKQLGKLDRAARAKALAELCAACAENEPRP